MARKCKFWDCKSCGRCYLLKGFELTDEAEKKMADIEKAWFRQGELTLCCREGFDLWSIAAKMKKRKRK